MEKKLLLMLSIVFLFACKSKTPCDKLLDDFELRVNEYVNLTIQSDLPQNQPDIIKNAFDLEQEVIKIDNKFDSIKEYCDVDSLKYNSLILKMKTHFLLREGSTDFITQIDMKYFLSEYLNQSDTLLIKKIFLIADESSRFSTESYLIHFYKAFKVIMPNEILFNLIAENKLIKNKEYSDDEVLTLLKNEYLKSEGLTILRIKKEIQKLGINNATVQIDSEYNDRLNLKTPILNEFMNREIRKIISNNNLIKLKLRMLSERNNER